MHLLLYRLFNIAFGINIGLQKRNIQLQHEVLENISIKSEFQTINHHTIVIFYIKDTF